MATKRLEYIDALRGFTMILVVFAHIINYGYHITDAKAETMDTFNNFSYAIIFLYQWLCAIQTRTYMG